MKNVDIYEIIYRDLKSLKNKKILKIEPDMKVSSDTKKRVFEILEEFLLVKAETVNRIKFSDIIYEMYPFINNETNTIKFIYGVKKINNDMNGHVNDYIDRFKYFNADNMPLIDIARFLNIKVEKSNIIEVYGQYIQDEKKIVMGTDEGRTFIHELVHAVDHFLPEYKHEEYHKELVAELSTVILCKMYSIPNNYSYSMAYLDSYTTTEINKDILLKRVLEIIEYIKKCKESIEGQQ